MVCCYAIIVNFHRDLSRYSAPAIKTEVTVQIAHILFAAKKNASTFDAGSGQKVGDLNSY